MEATNQQFSGQTAPGMDAATERHAQPNAQVTEGGFQNKINNAMSGDGDVDRVQHHAARQNATGAADQMDQAEEMLNSK